MTLDPTTFRRCAILLAAAAVLTTTARSPAQTAPATQPDSGDVLERAYSTQVPLIENGQAACAVIYPSEGEAWRDMAEQIAATVGRIAGVSVPVMTDTEAVPERHGPLSAGLRDKSLILLGDLNTNRAFFPFYACYLTCCDARYPGGDGYELRTVVRPFGRAANCLIVGASTPEGAAGGVHRLTQVLGRLARGKNVALPWLLEVKLGPQMAGILAPAIQELNGPPAPPPEKGGHEAEFTRYAQLYFYTGDERFAARSRDALARAMKTDAGQTGFGVGDYTLENLSAAWRRVSCSPAFSKTDLLALDRRMWQTAGTMSKAWWRIAPEKGIGNRHQTTGGLAFYTLIRDLQDLVEPDETARDQLAKWRSEAEAYCDGLLRHYWDDEDDYQSADSIQNAASYAMQAGRMEWFGDGMATRAAERLVMTVDNLGWYAGIQGYGDALPGWERFPLDAGMFMGACAFIYGDGAYLGVLERFPTLQDSWGSLQPWGLHQFDTGDRVIARPPAWMNGLQVARFTPYKLSRVNSGEFFTTSIMDNFRPIGFFARPVPEALAFDKLSYRSGPEPDDLYLLLEGSSGTTLTTIDMNAIIRLTDAGKLWLVHNTGRRSLFYKNAVYVGKGTNQQPMAPSSELLARHDSSDVAMVVSRLPDCRGITWTRNVTIARGQFCVVIDHLRAGEAGDYTLACNWRTPGWASIRDGRWEAVQDDVTFSIVPGSLQGVDSHRPAQRDGATRPTTLRENRSLRAAVDDEVAFENVLYTSRPSRVRSFDVRQAAPGAIVIRDAADGTLYLAAAGDRGIVLPQLRCDAASVLVTSAEICLAGGKSITIGARSWSSDSGRIALTEEHAVEIRAVLDALWNAAPARTPVVGKDDAGRKTLAQGPLPVWQVAGPGTRGAVVDGVAFVKGPGVTGLSLLATDGIMPLLAAEPRLMGRQQSELIRESREQQAGAIPAAEPILSPLIEAEFTLELPKTLPIGGIDIFGETFGQTAEPLPAGTLRLELTLSSDGFVTDRRVRQVEAPRRPTFHNLYKGHCYLFECYTVGDLLAEASAIRIRVLGGPGERLMISDVQIRTADSSRRPVPQVRVVDLDGDGGGEIIAWTGDGDLGVYRADGTRAWHVQLPEGILAVDAWDLDADGPREVFVSRLDRQVNVFNADGSPRWKKDYRDMKRETGGKYYGDGSAVYGMAVWKPASSQEPEAFFTSYWFTARLDPRGKLKEAFRRSGHAADIRMIPGPLAGAGGLAIRCDVPWPGSVPLQWWDASTGEMSFENAVPNGRCLFLEVDDYDGDGRPEALVAAEQGIGLYAPREPGRIWEHMTDAPPVGAGVLRDASGDGTRICYAREDGYVFVLGSDGRVLASTVLGEPLQCLTATNGAEPTVWVGSRTSLHGLRASDLSPIWKQDGACVQLVPLNAGGQQRVLAVTADGGLAAFPVGAVTR